MTNTSNKYLIFLITLLAGFCTTGLFAGTSSFDSRPNGMFGIGNEYPMVLMAVPDTDEDFQHVRELGINYVHLYGLSFDASGKGMQIMRRYLDMAQKHHLKVMFDLDGHRRMEKPNGLEELRKIVRAFKDHPALGFWYLADEPELNDTSPQTAELYYKAIKSESPDIPVCLLTATGPAWRDYIPALDVFSYDTYPVAAAPASQTSIEWVVDFNHLALQKGKPVLPCLQAFNYLFIDAERYLNNGTFHDSDKQKYLKSLRYPTQEELRYWNFATLAQGARGTIYFAYLVGYKGKLSAGDEARAGEGWEKGTHADPNWIDGPFKNAALEFKQFTDLVAPAWDHQIIPPGETQNILQAVWERGGKKYVVIVNNWAATRLVILSKEMMAPFQTGKVKPWGSSRQIIPYVDERNANMIKIETMLPWEVLIWEIDPG